MDNEFAKFCPFIGTLCRKDCTFRCMATTVHEGTTVCLIASKLDEINGRIYDQLIEISNTLEH